MKMLMDTTQLRTMSASLAGRDALPNEWVVDAAILLTLVLALIALIPCLAMLLLHVWLVAHGLTLHEWRQLRRGKRRTSRGTFDYGALNNLAMTLGIYPLLWLLPTRHGIEGNGIFYPEQERLLYMHHH